MADILLNVSIEQFAVHFIDKDKMNEIKFSEDTTQMSYSKNSFVYDFLYSLRQKINDPLGKKKIR